MALTQHFTTKLTLIFLFSSSIEASCAAVLASPNAESFDALARQPTFEELVKAKEYEKAVLALDPDKVNPRIMDRAVVKTGNIALIKAFTEKFCPLYPDTWTSLYRYGGLGGSATVCQALWALRHLANQKSSPIKLFLEMLIRAAALGNLEFIKWALQTLKEMNSLHELNRAKVFYSYERHNTMNPTKVETMTYASALIAAADNGHPTIVRMLLMHGADSKLRGCIYASGPLTCAGRREYLDIYERLRFYNEFKPYILMCVRNSTELKGVRNYPKPIMAHEVLSRCRELTSEHLFDEGGNTVLHNAVLAKNRKLILLCLTMNPYLIDAKNREGCTPSQLAFGKGFLEALRAILDLCYAVGKKDSLK